MGIIGIIAHLCAAVSAQRFTMACTGKYSIINECRCGKLWEAHGDVQQTSGTSNMNFWS